MNNDFYESYKTFIKLLFFLCERNSLVVYFKKLKHLTAFMLIVINISIKNKIVYVKRNFINIFLNIICMFVIL